MSTPDNLLNEVREKLKKEGLEKAQSAQQQKDKFFVVFLDDEAELLDTVADTIREFEFEPYATTSMTEALSFIEKNQSGIAYIISDFKMQNVTGFDFRSKAIEIAPDIPFAILSGNITKEMALRGVEFKISAFLDKPISPTKLAEILNKDGIARVQAIKEERELLQGFIEESSERLEQAEELALAFENNLNDIEAVNKCFGLVHTLKGASGYFKPKTLHQFVHRFEDLLKKLQRGETKLSAEVVTSILKSLDFTKSLLDEFKSGEHKAYDLEKIFVDFFSFNPNQSNPTNAPQEPKKEAAQPKAQEKSAQDEIRVPIALLDSFMHTSGEMTVIRNMLNKCVKSIEGQFPNNKDVAMLSELLEELHTINALTQTQISDLRKIPLHHILKPVPRVIRDISKALEKSIELVTVGDELAVDTTVAAVLNNSIIHLVRNSLDHGVEGPAEREKAGKDKKGKITITAQQKNEIIYICIEDDGRGIREEAIRNRLVKNGTHTEAQALALPKNELFAMIFAAGFSTAEKVTDISGRGVGMSMVKDSVESIGGHIEIESTPLKGSKFILVLPVPKSIMISNCLFVDANSMTFGIPQDSILRVVRMDEENKSNIFRTENSLSLKYDNHLVPVLSLDKLLNLRESPKSPQTSQSTSKIVVIGSKNRKLALLVDEVHDIEDTVIKHLQGSLKNIEAFQGAAFLGDSTVCLVLSPEGLLNLAKIQAHKTTNLGREASALLAAQTEHLKNAASDNEVILFRISQEMMYAVPTRFLFRIEELRKDQLATTGGISVVPYRGEILPLIDLDTFLNKTSISPLNLEDDTKNSTYQTLVLHFEKRFIGIRVHSIEDISRLSGETIPSLSKQFGIRGSALIGDRAVTVLDTEEIIRSICTKPRTPEKITEVHSISEASLELKSNAA